MTLLACPQCGATQLEITYHELSRYSASFIEDEDGELEVVEGELLKTDGLREPDVVCPFCHCLHLLEDLVPAKSCGDD